MSSVCVCVGVSESYIFLRIASVGNDSVIKIWDRESGGTCYNVSLEIQRYDCVRVCVCCVQIVFIPR